jgi:N-methylhydantoinase B
MANVEAPARNNERHVLDRIDPITFEILRHRLWVIQGELGTTIKAMSGSPIASEAGDFNTCLMDAEGNGVLAGLYITAQAAVTPWVVRSLIADYGLETVRPGDMYLCNDPWKGALHQNDVACVAPVFIEGELVAWVGSVIHQLDVGGPVPGGFAMGAQSIYEEAPLFPPIRIVRGGEVQLDVEAGYLRRSRLAHLMRLDLRAQIAANNIAMQRLREVAESYSVATLKDVCAGMIEMSERKLRRRLAEMPHAQFREVVLLDHDGVDPDSLYAIVIDVHNDANGLTVDFSQSSPQAPALINCTRTALEGAVVSALLSLLCYDMPWSPAAIERCVKLVSKAGTVCDASWPGGVSGGSVLGARSASYGVMSALGRLAALGDGSGERAYAGFASGTNLVQLFGARANGAPFGTMLMETGQGLAASNDGDGMDSGGLPDGPAASTGDVESAEIAFPILYLYRRENGDTGGAGRFRGGVTVSSAFQMYGGGASVYAVGQGYACPLSFGLMGGQPAPPINNFRIDGVAEGDMGRLHAVAGKLQAMFGDPATWPDFGGEAELAIGNDQALGLVRMQAKHRAQLAPGVIYATGGGGGGGFGDPWTRPVEAVVGDVEQGTVSVRGALADYGVQIDDRDGKLVGVRVARPGAPDGETRIEALGTSDGRRTVRVQQMQGGVMVDDRLEIVEAE